MIIIVGTASLRPVGVLMKQHLPCPVKIPYQFCLLRILLNIFVPDILFNSDDIVVPKSCTFLNQHALTNKNISDSVEAVLGVYLKVKNI